MCLGNAAKSEQRGICVLNLETKAVQIDSMIHDRESRSNVIFQPTPSSTSDDDDDDVPFFSLLIDGEWHTREATRPAGGPTTIYLQSIRARVQTLS